MSVNQDFAEMLSTLSGEGVEFLVVGAHALAAHGLPRATKDLDLWVGPGAGNAARAWRALAEFGAPLDQIDRADLERPGTIFQIGVPPHRIDVLTSIDGVSFPEAWARRASFRFHDLEIPVLCRDDLIAAKRAAGRPQDLVDLANLERLGS